MAIASAVPRGDVIASLNFYHPPADASAVPFNYVDAPPSGQPQRNYSEDVHDILIHDLRGREADFDLDRDAFQILSAVPPSAEPDFLDESIKNYYPEVEALLFKHVPGSNKIHIFDHTIRRAGASGDLKRGPVTRVHIDQTAPAVAKRVARYFPDEAEKLLEGRYRIVNVWRPLNKTPVASFPLAFASTSTVEDDNVVPIEHRYPNGYLGHTEAIKYSPRQKWYYLSGITGSEHILLKCFDSESLRPGSKIGGRVPHSAFIDPRTSEDAEGRESIEVRALVFGP